jgi:hypothetical protein
MKKVLLFIAAALIMVSCQKQGLDENTQDVDLSPWMGYLTHLKSVETRTLLAGQYIPVGTVTYEFKNDTGDPNDWYFEVVYTCDEGYSISETHMWCDDINLNPNMCGGENTYCLPINKAGAPRIGLFPHGDYYDPYVTSCTLQVSLFELPDYETGFAVSTHGVVHGDNFEETAWGEGSHFYDKAWGMYDCLTFDNDHTPISVAYGVDMVDGALHYYWVDVYHGYSELIYTEEVEDPTHLYGCVGFDDTNYDLYYIDLTASKIYKTDLADDSPSEPVGDLVDNDVKAGTFYDNAYYYVTEDNILKQVTVNSGGTIGGTITIGTIPYPIVVSDLAVDGSVVHIIGVDGAGLVQLVTYDGVASTWDIMEVTGLDATKPIEISMVEGELYAVQETNTGGWTTFVINVETGDTGSGTGDEEDPGGKSLSSGTLVY